MGYLEVIERALPRQRDGAAPWAELARWRWGPAAGDATPGIVVDVPDRGRLVAAWGRSSKAGVSRGGRG